MLAHAQAVTRRCCLHQALTQSWLMMLRQALQTLQAAVRHPARSKLQPKDRQVKLSILVLVKDTCQFSLFVLVCVDVCAHPADGEGGLVWTAAMHGDWLQSLTHLLCRRGIQGQGQQTG